MDSELTFRQLIDFLPQLCWTCRADGQCDYLSKPWEDYTGVPAASQLGFQWLDAVHPDDRERAYQAWMTAARSGDVLNIEFRIRRHDGVYRWFDTRATPLRDAQGEVFKWVGTNLDIDDRRRDEQRLRRLYESNLIGITFWAADGRLNDLNDRLLNMLGYTREEFLRDGINWRKITPSQWDAVDTEQMAILNAVGRCGPFEKEYFRKDGSRIPVLVSRADLDPGDHTHGIAFIIDVSRQKQIEAELRSSQTAMQHLNESLESRIREGTEEAQLRSEQLRALALDLAETESRERRRLAQLLHDHFQQLVSAAKLKAGIVRRRLGTESPLIGSVQQIESLLDDAIGASRSLATELSPPVLHDAGLGPALEWLTRRMSADHNLVVDLTVATGCEPDNEQVRVILFECIRELLFNVVKHSGVTEASLSLANLSEGLLQVRVRDAGKGFDATRLSTTRKPDGSFGLFSIRERLGPIGGMVTVKSSPGKGTVIDVTVPTMLKHEAPRRTLNPATLTTDAQPTAPASAPRAAPLESSGAAVPTIRVLVADDHRLFREGLISLISQESFVQVVGQAGDGAEAIEMARALRPDVMIVDVSMPRLNGVQVTAAMTREMPATRVIGLSMHERDDMARAMRDAGAIAYCSKGGPTDTLLALLRASALSHTTARELESIEADTRAEAPLEPTST